MWWPANLQGLLTAGIMKGSSCWLEPVASRWTGARRSARLPRTCRPWALSAAGQKRGDMRFYEYLDPGVAAEPAGAAALREVLELVEEMSPDDRVRLFRRAAGEGVRRLLMQLSPADARQRAQLLGLN